MKKTYGLIGISVLLLVGCSNAAEPIQETADTSSSADEQTTDELQVSGAIHARGDAAVYANEDTCIVGNPAVAQAMSGIEGSQVTVLDDGGSVAAVTEFEVQHSEDECIWFFNADVDGSSDFYRAEFLELETPVVSTTDAKDGVLMLDPSTPVQEEAKK